MIGTHLDYVKYRLGRMLKGENELSDWGVLIVEWHAALRWLDCDLCGVDGSIYEVGTCWKISRHLVGLPSGKDKNAKMVLLRCRECGNTKMVVYQTFLQNEKIRILDGLEGREPDALLLGDFKGWQARLNVPA